MKLTSFFVLMSLSTSVLANTRVEDLIEDHNLRPLQETEYWRQNPNTLPYEKCEFVSPNHWLKTKKGIFAIFAKHADRYDDENKQGVSLFCYSKKLQSAFQIPLAIEKDHAYGLALAFDLSSDEVGSMHSLDNRSLTDIFGKFKGFMGGIAFGLPFLGGDIAKLKNNGVKLYLMSISLAGFDVTFAKRHFHLGPRRLSYEEIYTQEYLERLALLIEARQERVAHVYRSGGTDIFLETLNQEGVSLHNLPENRKYIETSKFWIQYLQNFEGIPEGGPYEHAKIFGHLDYDFMTSLKFKKID